MIEDFLILLKTPLGEEIFITFLLPLIFSVLLLWCISKHFKFKKRNFLTALGIGFVYVIISFIIRSISPMFYLTDVQKPIINRTAMIVSNIILIVFIRKIYRAKWWKTILSWLAVYFGKFMFMGIVMMIMIFSFPILTEHDPTPYVKPGISEFYALDGPFETLKDNTFIVYRSKVVTPISIKGINLASDIAFNERREGITIDLECFSNGKSLVTSLREEGSRYKFGIPFDSYVWGGAQFNCDETCWNKKAKINNPSSREWYGTRIYYLERRKAVRLQMHFTFNKNSDSFDLNCNAYIITKNPSETIKKSFTIKYIAD